MSEVDLVLVRHVSDETRFYTYVAPKFSGLEKGDLVKLESPVGERSGTVEGVLEFVNPESTAFEFIRKLNGRDIYRIAAKVEIKKLGWEDNDGISC